MFKVIMNIEIISLGKLFSNRLIHYKIIMKKSILKYILAKLKLLFYYSNFKCLYSNYRTFNSLLLHVSDLL